MLLSPSQMHLVDAYHRKREREVGRRIIPVPRHDCMAMSLLSITCKVLQPHDTPAWLHTFCLKWGFVHRLGNAVSDNHTLIIKLSFYGDYANQSDVTN